MGFPGTWMTESGSLIYRVIPKHDPLPQAHGPRHPLVGDGGARRHLRGGGGRYDRVVWAEHFAEGMGGVLEAAATRFPVDLAAMPRFNESAAHGPRRAHPVPAYFDDLSHHLMGEVYGRDFDLFGYDRDDPARVQPTGEIDLDSLHAEFAA